MATFDELLAIAENYKDMVLEESVKGTIGRLGLKTVDTARFIKNKYDNMDKDSDKKEEPKKPDDKKENSGVAKVAKKIAAVPSAALVGAMDASSGAIAKVATAKEKAEIIKKYKNKPDELKVKLEEHKEKLLKVKQKVMTGEVAASSVIAIGPLDWALKTMIAYGSKATNNKHASKALVDGILLGPILAKKVSDIIAKKITGKEAQEVYSEVSSKVIRTLDAWAKSDLNEEKLTDKVANKVQPRKVVTESEICSIIEELGDVIDTAIYESVTNGEISESFVSELYSNELYGCKDLLKIFESSVQSKITDEEFKLLMSCVD